MGVFPGLSTTPTIFFWGGGVDYFITRNFCLNGDVRWAYTWDQGFGVKDYLPKAKGDFSYFAATIGFRVYLIDF